MLIAFGSLGSGRAPSENELGMSPSKDVDLGGLSIRVTDDASAAEHTASFVSLDHLGLRTDHTVEDANKNGTALGLIKGRLNVALPLRWDIDPYADKNWRANLQHWRLIDLWLLSYDQTDDISLIGEVIEVMLDWYRFHCIEGRQSDRVWQKTATGLRAARLAFVFQEIKRHQILVSAAKWQLCGHSPTSISGV